MDPLWEKCKVHLLKTNHRQGKDKEYADILNRIRVGEQTKEDLKRLNTRVFPRDSPLIPKDALLITGTNAIVNNYNNAKLNELPGELFEFKAEVFSNTRGEFVPKVDNAGQVKGTTLQYVLNLKVGCRVMLTWNIDVCDNLANGSLGKVLGFKRDSKNKVKYILVKFDDPSSGRERRKQINFEKEYPGENATAIDLMEFDFTIGDKSTATATAINFCLRLAYASTAHKIQGHTVRKPNSLILDLHSWLESAMIYVMLSRVQSLNQLYILESLPEEKVKPFPEALEELERLQKLDTSKPEKFNSSKLKIISLNTRSLSAHEDDIKADQDIVSSDVVCLQETWINEFDNEIDKYSLEEKQLQLNSKGRGKGLATYYSDNFEHQIDISEAKYQITSLKYTDLTIVNIYRSSDSNDKNLIEHLNEIISSEKKSIILCGDMNICEREQSNHPVLTFLKTNDFMSGFNPPQSTHQEGRCLDLIYHRLKTNFKLDGVVRKACYWSDHDKLEITLMKSQEDE